MPCRLDGFVRLGLFGRFWNWMLLVHFLSLKCCQAPKAHLAAARALIQCPQQVLEKQEVSGEGELGWLGPFEKFGGCRFWSHKILGFQDVLDNFFFQFLHFFVVQASAAGWDNPSQRMFRSRCENLWEEIMTLVWELQKKTPCNWEVERPQRPGLGRFRDAIGKGPPWKDAVFSVTVHSLRYQR